MRKRTRILILCGILLAVSAAALNTFKDAAYRLPVLMYHYIDYTADAKNKITVSPEAFARQMKFLRDDGYDVVSLEKAVAYIADRKKPSSRTVAITFDDGRKDNYVNAFPVVKKYNIPITIFVITDKVGKNGYLNWEEIREMSDSGVVDIESHTISHPWLPSLDDVALKSELEGSKKILEEKLGKRIDYIAYPMGGYDERVKTAAKAAGYKAAFATKPRRSASGFDIFEIKRVRISPTANNLLVFFIKVSGYHAFFRVLTNDYLDMSVLSLAAHNEK